MSSKVKNVGGVMTNDETGERYAAEIHWHRGRSKGNGGSRGDGAVILERLSARGWVGMHRLSEAYETRPIKVFD